MIQNVVSYLEQSYKKYPEQTALADCTNRMTYRQVWEYVSNVGSLIHLRLAGKNKPVAVCINHDITDVLNFLSIVYSGNFYIPIDLSLPQERVMQMLKTIEPAAVIADKLLKLSDEVNCDNVWISDSLREEKVEITNPWKSCKDTDLLYVMFTSGSTGEPKGVAISHRSVIDMVEQFSKVFSFRENSIFGNQAPFDFDVSVKDIYISLKVGGTLEILEKKLFSFPKFLIERLNERKVSTVIWAVPALNIIARLNAFKEMKPKYLENVMFSGEVMPANTLEYWQEKLPDVRYVNLYGPTEITCNCTYYIIDNKVRQTEISIGQAFPNCSVFLLEDDTLVSEEGKIGEICVTGSCLALGYYNRPELTRMAFTSNPLQKAYTELMYRTGDLGCYKNRQLIFMGRRDTQIKHAGHRIEMTEIELCANSMEGIEAAACVYDQQNSRMVLFYQGQAEKKETVKYLKEKLPRYMLPNDVRAVAGFPQTRTGKIDRKELLAIVKGEK